MSLTTKKIISILGTTGIGKTNLAINIAKKVNGEIISCDSMQIYQGLAIGTGQPSQQQLAEVKHHLIDEYELSKYQDASIFVKKSKAIIDDITNRGKTPILVGGTGMYARLLLYDGKMLQSNKFIAQQVRQEFKNKGFDILKEELASIDPVTADKVGDNKRRLFRALEVIRITKHPIKQNSWLAKLNYEGCHYILLGEPSFNRQQIIKRIDQMLQAGWIEEAKQVIDKGLLDTPTAWQALGYRNIADYLVKDISYNELVAKLATLTNRYAKRQRTWFRYQHHNVNSYIIDSEEKMKQVSEQIISKCCKYFQK